MNPWLERPSLWGSVHARVIVALADDLNPHLRPRYQAEVEEYVYVATLDSDELLGKPDITIHKVSEAKAVYSPVSPTPIVVEIPQREEIRHRWLEVRDVSSGEVVTVIEVLSPINKRPGEGRAKYEQKRNNVLASSAHFVEIDLLRGYEPLPIRWRTQRRHSDYRLLVSRVGNRPLSDLYPFNVREPIPRFPLPLREGDSEPIIDLGAILSSLYERANYDLTIDYNVEPDPPLTLEDAAWAKEILKLKA